MSNNNSLSGESGIDLPSQYALRVALQTMKERCVALQQRLSTVEEENILLRNQTPINLANSELNILRGAQSEVENFRKQVEDLTRQKLQLTEHIAMVATENRQLWSRLSQLAKDDKQKQQHEQKKQSETIITMKKSSTSSTENQHPLSGQNLIRSRTFTQHSPNPLLRQKHLDMAASVDKSLDDLSLEEISLKDCNSDEKLTENEKSDEILSATTINGCLGFGFLNDDSSNIDQIGDDGDLGIEAKKCIDGMIDIKREVLKQQGELAAVLDALKEKKAKALLQECEECKRRDTDKPETADKIIEAKLDDTLQLKSVSLNTNSYIPHSSSTKSNRNDVTETGFYHHNHIDFLEEKRRDDKMVKLCPMCGKMFDDTIKFDKFQEHVEEHFTDDSELDPATFERNFELVSHAVGDF